MIRTVDDVMRDVTRGCVDAKWTSRDYRLLVAEIERLRAHDAVQAKFCAIVKWMEDRAKPCDGDDAAAAAWREAVAEIASEIEMNEIEQCGHNDPDTARRDTQAGGVSGG